ncbi:MAG: hypothetical protein LBW85_11690 [Deltaproteobacteria bacterium]|nr:hypothetical protein [Deltaproteobacteria bacterium]
MAGKLPLPLNSFSWKKISRAMDPRNGCLSEGLTRQKQVVFGISLDAPGDKPAVLKPKASLLYSASLLGGGDARVKDGGAAAGFSCRSGYGLKPVLSRPVSARPAFARLRTAPQAVISRVRDEKPSL